MPIGYVILLVVACLIYTGGHIDAFAVKVTLILAGLSLLFGTIFLWLIGSDIYSIIRWAHS